MDPELAVDLDTTTQEILLAASNHDVAALKPFLRVPGAASVQDSETGTTPLHAAISACGVAKGHTNGHTDSLQNGHEHSNTASQVTNDGAWEEEEEEEEVYIEKAKATLKELFLSGAIWNDLDMNDETPGCLAWRLGQKELYEMVVEAGVRAEFLMNLMGQYELLADGESDKEEEEEEENEEEAEEIETDIEPPPPEPFTAPSTSDELPASSSLPLTHPDASTLSSAYLTSPLTLTHPTSHPQHTTLLDASHNGIMMTWETPIMRLSSALLCPTPGLRILNIGFGLGIIDSFFAATSPAAHHIIEAHPDVLAAMRSAPPQRPQQEFAAGEGGDTVVDWREWEARPGNNVHEGRWQDVVEELVAQGEVFDVIYFDTFAEPYRALKTFFTEYVIALLAPEGRFGFFNGMGADRQVCYDVYCRVVEGDLWEAGLGVDWMDVDVDMGEDGKGEWEGVRRRYWALSKYRLPICRFLG